MHHSPSALQVLPRVSLDEAFLQTYILWTKVPLSQKRCCTAVYRKTAGHHSACQGSGPASTVLIGQGSATPSALSVTTFACSNRHDVVRNASLFRTISRLKVELHKTDRANGRWGPLDSLLRLSSVVALPSESLKNEKEGVAESWPRFHSSSRGKLLTTCCWLAAQVFSSWSSLPQDHFSSVQFSHSVMSDSLRPNDSQLSRPPCLSPTPRVYSNSCPLSQQCHPAISSSAIHFSSRPQSLPASESFPMSQLFTWGGQSIGVSTSASALPMNTQDWSPLGWTGWLSLQSMGLWRVFSNI